LILSVTLIRDTLQVLTELIDSDKDLFYKMYRNIPYEIYQEIEKLSVSKSEVYRDLCINAKKITTEFHNSPKFITYNLNN